MKKSSPYPTLALFVGFVCMFLLSCGGPSFHFQMRQSDDSERETLEKVAEEFYAGHSAEEMRAAVQKGLVAHPRAALSNEIAALLAHYDCNPSQEFTHWVRALLVHENASAEIHFRHLLRIKRGDAEDILFEALMRAMAAEYPSPALRGLAVSQLAKLRLNRGESIDPVEAFGDLGMVPQFSLIGSWDNDQGKAFEAPLMPEKRIHLGDKAAGTLSSIQWMVGLPPSKWIEIDLADRVQPDEWSVAYLAAGLDSAIEQSAALRISSSDPIRVWLNETLVFSAQEVVDQREEQFIVPVVLRSGINALLIKSAQREEDWKVQVRLTGPDGGPLEVPVAHASPEWTGTREADSPRFTPNDLALERVQSLPIGSARRAYHHNFWLKEMGQSSARISRLDESLLLNPKSLALNHEYSMALWNNFEVGRTSSQLQKMESLSPNDFPLFLAKRGRFLQQRKRYDKARPVFLEGLKIFPNAEALRIELATLYSAERWYEDASRELEATLKARPGVLSLQGTLASLYERRGLQEEGTRWRERGKDRLAGNWNYLWQRFQRSLKKSALQDALNIATSLKNLYPAKTLSWRLLAQAQRREGNTEEAITSLKRALDLSPQDAKSWKKLGQISYETGEPKNAIEYWTQALVLDPDDSALAHRLIFLRGEKREPWQDDIPNVEEEVAAIEGDAPTPSGANLAIYLDHEVTRLYDDGSAANVVTLIARALNEAGRDRLTKNKMQGAGRKRVLAAFAINSSGVRIESSAIRGDTVRFRGLDVGSMIALQYRADAPPSGYLSKYLARTWNFHGGFSTVKKSEWALWLPKKSALHTKKIGNRITEKRSVHNDLMRVVWTAENVPPIVPESLMPPVAEVGDGLWVSTVPEWSHFIDWEKALLENAFRDSPALKDLTNDLIQKGASKKKNVEKIYEFVMQEIRYQQDYENEIAGVKPHAAPTVLERRYGDCKDKTVLFTQLAKAANIDVHFALIRTRGRGPVAVGVPMQQFNHVIPYIPAQEGLSEGFFVDPTADALDLSSLRNDDVGTRSLVYNPVDSSYQWVDVPYQSPDDNRLEVQLDLTLESSGLARGKAAYAAVGRSGSQLRVSSRNQEQFKRVMESLTGMYVPGSLVDSAEVIEVKDLKRPAQFRADFRKEAFLRQDGKTFRAPVPTGWKPANLFQKETRVYPMLLGIPSKELTTTNYTLPKGSRIQQLPGSFSMKSPCILFKRSVSNTRTTVQVKDTLQTLCERIEPSQYQEHREFISRLVDARRAELVLKKR